MLKNKASTRGLRGAKRKVCILARYLLCKGLVFCKVVFSCLVKKQIQAVEKKAGSSQ